MNERIRVVDEDTGRDVEPGSGAIGLLAMGGRIPLGYFKDPEKTRSHVPHPRRRPLLDPG